LRREFVQADGVQIDIRCERVRLAAPAPITIDAEISAESREPRIEAGATIVGRQGFEEFDENLLRQVLGCSPVTS
jgi:hypothetical protein